MVHSCLTGQNPGRSGQRTKEDKLSACLSHNDCYLELKEHILLHWEVAMCADFKKSQTQVLKSSSSRLSGYGFAKKKRKKSRDFICLVSRQVASKTQIYTLCHLFSHLPSLSVLQQPEASWETMSTLKCKSSQQRVNLNRTAWTNSSLNVSSTVCRSVRLWLRHRLSCSHYFDHPSSWHSCAKSQKSDKDLRSFCSKWVDVSFQIHCEFSLQTDCPAAKMFVANSWLTVGFFSLSFAFFLFVFCFYCFAHAVAHFWLREKLFEAIWSFSGRRGFYPLQSNVCR